MKTNEGKNMVQLIQKKSTKALQALIDFLSARHVGKGQLFCCEYFLLGFLCIQRVILQTNALAYVLTGYSYTSLADSLLIHPPLKSGTIGDNNVQHRYDSVNGYTHGLTVYITYENESLSSLFHYIYLAISTYFENCYVLRPTQ